MLAMEFAGCSDMPDCSSSGSSSLTCQSPQFCIPIFHPRNYKNRVLASKIAPQACRVLPTSAYGICQMFGFPPPDGPHVATILHSRFFRSRNF